MQRSPKSDHTLAELVRVQSAIKASGDVLYDWDLASDELSWSGSLDRLFGAAEHMIPSSGDTFHRLVNPEDLPQRMAGLKDHFAGLEDYDCEFRVRDQSGEFLWVHDRGAVELSSTGTPMRMFGVLRHVTHRKQHEAKLEYLANFDDLTGHFNKLRLRDALDQALAQGQRFEQGGAFLVIGIDQLGRINTAYGHEAGDSVLLEVAKRLDHTLRNADVIGRLDSDCFGVVLSGYDSEQAQRAAERILQAIRNDPIEIEDRHAHVTASVSIVLFPTHARTAFDVITKAESALLNAKRAGRDCITVYEMSEEQLRDQVASMTVAEEVKEALREDRMVLVYQPVVDAETRQVSFYECLLRMRQSGGALVSADRFIPVVERLGLIRTVDRRVLELALRTLDAHPGIVLSINISGLTATDRTWLRALKTHLKGQPHLGQRLIIEITETAALDDIEESANFVTTVRELGCRVALDDFGAGYTTFRHLKALTVDVVKIDGSFVRGISSSNENQLFIRNLLNLTRSFGLTTVAECVENEKDADYLRDEGIDLLQGHQFGKPKVQPNWAEGAASPAATGRITSQTPQAAI